MMADDHNVIVLQEQTLASGNVQIMDFSSNPAYSVQSTLPETQQSTLPEIQATPETQSTLPETATSYSEYVGPEAHSAVSQADSLPLPDSAVQQRGGKGGKGGTGTQICLKVCGGLLH